MARTTIGHVMTDEYDIYIGRGKDPHSGQRNGLGNPYSILDDGKSLAQFKCTTIDECCDKYREHVLNTPGLLDRLRSELQGKRLACWCTNTKSLHQCHGDVIIDLLDGPNPEGQRWLPSVPSTTPATVKQLAQSAPPQAVIKTKPLLLPLAPARQTIEEIPMFSQINSLLGGHRLVLTIHPVAGSRINVTAAFENEEYCWAPDLVVEGDAKTLDTKFVGTLQEYLTSLGAYQTNMPSVKAAVVASKGVVHIVPGPTIDGETLSNNPNLVEVTQEALQVAESTDAVEPVTGVAEVPVVAPVRNRRRTKVEMEAARAAEAAKLAAPAAEEVLTEEAPVEAPAPAPAKSIAPTPINGPVRGRPIPVSVPMEIQAEQVEDGIDTFLEEETITGATGTDNDFPF